MNLCEQQNVSTLPRSLLAGSAEAAIAQPSKKQLALMALSEEDRVRFWAGTAKVNSDDPDSCIIWLKSKTEDGYGYFCLPGKVVVRAHRASYLIANGELPSTAFICHRCDNPGCVNPAHLFLGTNRSNILDASAKGRLWNQRKTHCKNGHAFTPENTNTNLRGRKRQCMTCVRECNARRKLKIAAIARQGASK